MTSQFDSPPSSGARVSSPHWSAESGVGSQCAGSTDTEDDVFSETSPPITRLSGDSGFADGRSRRRRTKSDSAGRSRVLSLKDDMRSFISAGARRFADSDIFARRTRSQSIAEEGEYHFDRQQAAQSHLKSAGDRQRRNSDYGRVQNASCEPEAAPSSPRKRTPVRQFLDNFRPRSRSENQQSMTRPKKLLGARDSRGGLVNRLRQMSVDPDGRRKSPGSPLAHGLPHPRDMPLDHSFCADLAADNRARMRKAISVEESGNNNPFSDPPESDSVHERHKDLFENLSHLSDEGQYTILSPTALAESHRMRRLSGPCLSLPESQRQRMPSGSDVKVTENEKYIIFSSNASGETGKPDIFELMAESKLTPDRVFEIFAKGHTCYDVLPISSKLLVFDSSLNVKKAFFALVYNGLRSAPVWDKTQQKFVGMLTVTDFIYMLHGQYRSPRSNMEELETHKISTWRAELLSRHRPLQWISPEASLLQAVRLLLHSRVHRLPVIDPRTGNALFIITHKRVLKYIFLFEHQLPMPDWLNRSVAELKVGTFADIVTVDTDTPVIHALGLFLQHRVSCLPVLDLDGRLIDIYSKFDVINLAATKMYSKLDVSVGEALKYRRDRFEGVETCTKEDSLLSVMQRLVVAEVHRLVMVDADKRVVGLVSLSDILEAVVFKHEHLAALAGCS